MLHVLPYFTKFALQKNDSGDTLLAPFLFAWMTWIDAIILTLLGAGAVIGFRRGLVRQVSAIVGLALGILACLSVGDYAAELLRTLAPGWQEWPSAEQSSQAVALALLFMLVFAVAVGAGLLVKGVTRVLLLGIIDRLAGGAFGMGLALLLLSVALNLWAVANPDSGLQSYERQEADHALRMVMRAAPCALGGGSLPASTGGTGTESSTSSTAEE